MRKNRTSLRRWSHASTYAGDYADIVFFDDLEAIDRVIEAERTSEVWAAFFSIMDGDDENRIYEVVKTYK